MSPSPAGQRAGAAAVPGLVRGRGRAAGGHLAQVHTVVVRVLNTAETWHTRGTCHGHGVTL